MSVTICNQCTKGFHGLCTATKTGLSCSCEVCSQGQKILLENVEVDKESLKQFNKEVKKTNRLSEDPWI